MTSESIATTPIETGPAAPATPTTPTALDAAPAPPPPPPRPAVAVRLKHGLLRLIDLAALSFLEPVVRLCYREEPAVQLRKIGRFVLVPVLAMVLFLALWSVVAPLHTTKFGAVPTPAQTYDAFLKSMVFHVREGEKAAAYTLVGAEREQQRDRVAARLEQLPRLISEAEAEVAAAQALEQRRQEREYQPLAAQIGEMRRQLRAATKEREAALATQAASLTAGDQAGKAALRQAVAAHNRQTDAERASYARLKERANEVLKDELPLLRAAKAQLTLLAEERQHLDRLAELLGDGNRQAKLSSGENEIASLTARYASVSGAEVLGLAEDLHRQEERLTRVQESSYAAAWTLPAQILRSVLCVFVGFVIGSAIAVPIGVLCGLSSTFMAAMTPFIALFKPVSPIVWLLVFLIIVGGFIDNPDDHWLIQGLTELPLIGWMGINPAFMASALTVAMCSLWATMVNTALGVASVDKDHLNVARVLRLGFWARLRKIILPSALPLMFAGMRISLGVGWMVLIAAELLASSEGIGKYVWDMFNNGSPESFAKIMSIVFVVGIIGLLLDRIMIVFQRLVSFEGSVAAV